MQRTADFHHQIADARLPQAARVVDDAAALDTTVDMFDADAPACDPSIRGFLGPREGAASWLLGRHDDLDVVEHEGQEAEILQQSAACGQGIRRGIRDALVVGTAGIGVTQKQDRKRSIDQQHVFHRVALFLAAIIARLLSRILGTSDASFGPIMPKRGEAGAGAGTSTEVGDPGVGVTRERAAASATPRRVANSCTERVGASAKARSVARRTTRRT
jgi:hypothetical protein